VESKNVISESIKISYLRGALWLDWVRKSSWEWWFAYRAKILATIIIEVVLRLAKNF